MLKLLASFWGYQLRLFFFLFNRQSISFYSQANMLIRFESAPEPKLRQVLQVRWADDGGWKEGWGRD